MDRGLKERLVGAAVLVALGVWLIPWVLDGSDRSIQTESDALMLPAPSDSPPLRSQTITLDNDREPPTPALGSSGAETQESARDEVSTARAQPSSHAAASTPVQSSSAAGAGWFVQAGSYADIENARRQAERVSSYGFEVQVTIYTAGGRQMQRVRIGPQSSRDSAQAVASALSDHGFVVQVFVEE